MSERAAMKRRVRGLLHHSWLNPLCALLLAWLPVLVISLLVGWLMRPQSAEVAEGAFAIAFSLDDPMGVLLQLITLLSEPLLLFEPLFGWLPMTGILLFVHIFFSMPICVSVASYFLSFLRGKNPKITEVYGSFSGRYPRALGGMAYKLLWVFIWFAASFLVPTALIFGSVPLVSILGIELNVQIYLFVGILILSIAWYIIFFFLFLNRLLAYSLTPVALAAQPRLPAHRAVRLSRKLMRGCKWRLIGLYLSFINYFLPAVISGVLLVLISLFGTQIGLTGILQSSIRTFLWVVIFANQLIWLYVAPYLSASFHAFYIERKREALMDEEVTPDDFAAKPKPDKPLKELDKKVDTQA